MPSSPIAGLPYPAATDPVTEGAAAIQALATALDPVAMWKIADQLLAAADAATIDFSAIPATYRHLKLVLSLRSNMGATTDHMTLRFNNDSAATYYALLNGYVGSGGLTSYVSNAATKGACGLAVANTGDAATFGVSEILIPDYASATKKKIYSAFSGGAWANVGLNTMWALSYAGLWGPSLAAISRVTLLPLTGTLWLAGSRATLYGLR